MPALSPTMTEGTLAKWLKKSGDKVKAGDVIAEIETDKATMEVEAVDEGTIGKILIEAGTSNVAVNTPIAVLLEEGESSADIKAAAPPPSTQPSPPKGEGAKETKETKETLAPTGRGQGEGAVPPHQSFMDALLDDLNTAGAINELHALAKKLSQNNTPENREDFLFAAHMLGILQEDPDTWLGYTIEGDTKWIEDLLIERTQAKASKDFKRADEIRDELKSKSIEIEDTPQGSKWRKI